MVKSFVPRWNGKAKILPTPVTSASLGLFTDASNKGMGGVWGAQWFSCAWPSHLDSKHINVKELLAISAAILTWGQGWRDLDVIMFTDNKPISQIWLSGATKNKEIMHILRNIFYFLAGRNVNVRLEHVFGYNNVKADLLSRLQVPQFLARYPVAHELETPVSPAVWEIWKDSDANFYQKL